MRFYTNFSQALNELKRELKEMGIKIHQRSVQNKIVENNPDYDAYELQNYTYTVTSPNWKDIPLSEQAGLWCQAEFYERISGRPLNPGEAWKFRTEYWSEFFSKHKTGKFDYTYPERMMDPLYSVVEALKKDPFTRRAFLPIFDRQEDVQDDFSTRIPCSLGYWFYFRQEKLHITYLQRSADFSEHFKNDIYLADRLKCHIAEELGMQPGNFSHWLGSLHIFAKDVKNVF